MTAPEAEQFGLSWIPRNVPRVALVTGGARRIGRALVEMLAAQGMAVAIHCHRSWPEAQALLAELEHRGGRGCVVQADLGEEEALLPMMAQVREKLGAIGVLVNNASVFRRDEFSTVTRHSWDQHMEPNLRAPFVLSQELERHLPSGAEGLILNMLDQRVWNLTPHFVSYTVARSALWSLTQSMALGFAPRIRVNAIGPGPVLPALGQSEAQFEAMCAKTPLQRPASPEEIARAALMLFSLPSVTGQMLALDSGQHLNWGYVPPADSA
ncbi:SDR family oxidoreductase [Oecophyllibacter saccharovorans]|uniref:SDR family oxidoreductase n=1 Tax=Oecophyllibacter saccharovorans TaxID=2558360 RepID=UPI001166A79F|nr:SDR family oxidoreductase [Oecophyllibacter saccharovorans]TPW36358.1 SDR family oxidoreductase [Oecophyllibacter saccharovorans]